MVFSCHWRCSYAPFWLRKKLYDSILKWPVPPPMENLLAYCSKVCFLSNWCHRLITNSSTCNHAKGIPASIFSFSQPCTAARMILWNQMSDHDTALLKVFQWLSVAMRKKAKSFLSPRWSAPSPTHLVDLICYPPHSSCSSLPSLPSTFWNHQMCMCVQGLCTCCSLCGSFLPDWCVPTFRPLLGLCWNVSLTVCSFTQERICFFDWLLNLQLWQHSIFVEPMEWVKRHVHSVWVFIVHLI